jgi:hypothetical protein
MGEEAVEQEESTASLWDVSMTDYLAETSRWSATTLGKMIDREEGGPRVAWLLQNRKISLGTKSQAMGNVTHAAIWEGTEAFQKRYVVANQNTKVGKDKAAEAKITGQIVITQATYDEAMSTAEGVIAAAHERAADGDSWLADFLAAPGLREQSMIWEDMETRLPLKGRADKLLTDVPVIGDLKTSKAWRPDPHEWVREAIKYGCHRQAWLYSSAYWQIFGKWPRFIFIVVHNKAPYQVGLYEMPKQVLQLGREQARRAMKLVIEHQESGRWFEPCERGIVEVEYPDYAYQDERMEWTR